MANDLIIIRCKTCGEYTTLGKYYPTLTRYGVDTSKFVTKHLWDCIEDFPIDLEEDPVFELLTELQMGKRKLWREQSSIVPRLQEGTDVCGHCRFTLDKCICGG